MAAALAVAGLGFGAWLLLVAQPGSIAAGAADDPTTTEFLGSSSLLYLARWAAVHGIGPFGAAAVLLGLLGLSSGGRERRLAPWLLAASALGLLALHTAVPHKEARYLVPAFGPLAVLAALGLAALEDRSRWARAAAVASVAALLLGTFTLAPRAGDPVDTHLRLAVDPDDAGLQALVDRVAGETADPVLVASSLSGDRWMEVRDMLAWELYARSDRPVLLLPPERDLRWQHARDKLRLAHRFLADAPPTPADREALAEAGFAPATRLLLPIPGMEAVELWERRE